MWLGKLLFVLTFVGAATACSSPQITRREPIAMELPASIATQRFSGGQWDWTYGPDIIGALKEIHGVSGDLSSNISIIFIWPHDQDTASLEGKAVTYRLGFPRDSIAPFASDILVDSCKEYLTYSPSAREAGGADACKYRWLGNDTLRSMTRRIGYSGKAYSINQFGNCCLGVVLPVADALGSPFDFKMPADTKPNGLAVFLYTGKVTPPYERVLRMRGPEAWDSTKRGMYPPWPLETPAFPLHAEKMSAFWIHNESIELFVTELASQD